MTIECLDSVKTRRETGTAEERRACADNSKGLEPSTYV